MKEPTEETRWGRLAQGWFWFGTLLFLPVAVAAGSGAGSLLGLLGGWLLVLPVANDPRLGHSPIYQWVDSFEPLLATALLAGAALLSLLVVTWWLGRSPLSVRLHDDRVVSWSILGRKTIRLADVCLAYVTVPAHEGASSERLTLHLSTRWRDLAVPMHRLMGHHSPETRKGHYEVFVTRVGEQLRARGKALELGVVRSFVTNTTHPLLYALFWPHRRVLAHRAAVFSSDVLPRYRHDQPLASPRLAWLLRPAPVLFGLSLLSLVLWVRFGTQSPRAPLYLLAFGILAALALPLYNLLKEGLHRLFNRHQLTPESLIGATHIQGPLERLKPAPGCLVDLEAQRLLRPDGVEVPFADIDKVEYGPHSAPGGAFEPAGALQRAVASTAWHLAVHTRRGRAERPVEIYGNASVDIVRYGDLDAGYAMFNWLLARHLALSAGADLALAHGRVPRGHLARSLAERLGVDITRYEPDPIELAMVASGESSRVHYQSTPERFVAWGPLTRQPESCATPPIYKAAGVLAALGAMALVWPPAGLLLGYLLATSIGEGLTSGYFARPGFMMDKRGVFVRGQHIPWAELEESTLMPIAPGPILFCGSDRVLVAGHLGSSYHERARLGCAAYQWIQTHIKEERL